MTNIVVDPNGGALPIRIALRRDGFKYKAFLRFNRFSAKNSQVAERVLSDAIGNHGFLKREFIGGSHIEIETDFSSEEEVVQCLNGKGAVI